MSKLVLNGQSVALGGGSFDGNPIGTVLSFMGTKAPTGYLACDGTIYNISDFSLLASFFTEQFGESNYFGGDGIETFGVPDMRDLFLRGFGGDNDKRLSGAIGDKQEATIIPNIYVASPGGGISQAFVSPIKSSADPNNPARNQDAVLYTDDISSSFYYSNSSKKDSIGWQMAYGYSARPVNMAILYCIKYS